MTGPQGSQPGDGDGNDQGAGDPRRDGSLTGRTLVNFLWMFAGGGAEAILKIVVLLILARVLLPQEFGVASAALTVVALAEVTGRIGVAPSIVQVRDLTRAHVETGFVATFVMGVLLAALFLLLSGPIAGLYRMPQVEPLIQVFSLLFIVKGAGLVSEALLQRQMRFREIAVLHLISYVLGYAAVAITMAVMGYGAWALVWGQIVQAIILTLGFVALAREGVGVGFQWAAFASMFRFGLGVTLTQIGNYVSQNADYFVVGRYLGAEALGFYSRAYLLLKQTAQVAGKMGDTVLFPTLATIQEDRPRLQRALNRALALVAMVQVPMTALLVVSAPEIILVLMGPQWGPAVIPFQILVGVLFFRTAYKFVGSILRAAGKVYISAIWQWSHALAVIAGAYFGQAYGLTGVSVGVSAAVVFCHFFGLFLVKATIGVGSAESILRLVAYSVLGLAFASILIAARLALLPAVGGMWTLVLLFAGFGVLYLGVFAAVPSLFGAEGGVLRELILGRLRRRRGKKP